MKPLRSCPRKTRGVPPLLVGLGFCSWAEMAYRERRCELDSGHKKVAPRHKARLPAVPRLLGGSRGQIWRIGRSMLAGVGVLAVLAVLLLSPFWPCLCMN